LVGDDTQQFRQNLVPKIDQASLCHLTNSTYADRGSQFTRSLIDYLDLEHAYHILDCLPPTPMAVFMTTMLYSQGLLVDGDNERNKSMIATFVNRNSTELKWLQNIKWGSFGKYAKRKILAKDMPEIKKQSAKPLDDLTKTHYSHRDI
jgi:hypothetical protein